MRRPTAREVRRIDERLKLALSRMTVAVLSVISEFSPPMMPASATGFSPSAMQSISVVSSRTFPSSVVIRSPSAALRTTMDLRNVGRVKRVHRLAVFQHHIVRDVDDVVGSDGCHRRARAHPAETARCARFSPRARYSAGRATASLRLRKGSWKCRRRRLQYGPPARCRSSGTPAEAAVSRAMPSSARTVGAVEGTSRSPRPVAQPQHVADVVAKFPTGLLHNENTVLDRVREVVDRQPLTRTASRAYPPRPPRAACRS